MDKILERILKLYRERKKKNENVGVFVGLESWTFDEDDHYGKTEEIICVKTPEAMEIIDDCLYFDYNKYHVLNGKEVRQTIEGVVMRKIITRISVQEILSELEKDNI